ncbi:MAG: phosphodiester glycosidase family protein [Intestinimonas sp.]|nr:phosphodiester glycosidase family protein [Intestinimonas sp.]
MRHFRSRFLAAGLALSMALSTAASASVALGDDIHASSVTLGEGTTLTRQVFWSNTYSDLRQERYFTYTPNAGVHPKIAYGDSVLSKNTLSKMAASLQNEGYRVLGGVNGDFYVVATGQPLGVIVDEGRLVSSASYLDAVGFYADGTAFIGKPQLSVTATFRDHALLVADVNKIRTSTGGYDLLTDDFSSTTENTKPGIDVVLSPVSEVDGNPAQTELTIGGSVTCTVDQVLQSTDSISIPEGKMVLTINNDGDAWLVSELAALQPGDTVKFDVSSQDSRWNDSVTALGGMYRLITDGVVSSDLDNTANPRTAIGVKANGDVVVYAIDGRQPGWSIGATLTQVANRMAELGCVDAIGMDGGGSTMLGATLPGSDFNLFNSPSDGSQRAVTNGLFLVSKEKATDTLGSFSVTPYDNLVLAGTQLQMYATALDTAYYPMAYTGNVTWAVTNGDGSITPDGVLTTGSAAGVTHATASAGNVSGTADITVVKKPDSVSIRSQGGETALSTLSLSPNEAYDLTASAVYKGLVLTSQDDCFTWSADPSVGTITEDGVLTAASKSGMGTVTVSAGGRSASITVAVTGHIKQIDGFENGVSSLVGSDSMDVQAETSADLVRFGSQSARLDYEVSSGSASATADLPIASGERWLSLWVYGDESGNALTATVQNSSGESSALALTGINFTGWKQIQVELPSDASALTALSVIYAGGDAPTAGTLWLDQITTANEDISDHTAPDISLSRSGTALTATVTDNVDQSFDSSSVLLTVDGKSENFTWSDSGKLSATLPVSDGKMHRITVTAVDQSGNLGRASDTVVSAESSAVFDDMKAHWASPYTAYLYEQGVVSGMVTESSRNFLPDQEITRGDFALMVTRWMGLNTSDYSEVQLPFADIDSIPSWDLNAVKAMYQLGVMKGSNNSGTLLCRAKATITRAEAMTLLGRIQKKGYSGASLNFTDADSVPDWALPYVETLTHQGVVGGYNGYLRPSDGVLRCEVAKMLVVMW